MTFDIDANGILHVSRQGPRHRQGADDPDHRLQRPHQGRDREDGEGRRGPRRRGQEEARGDRRPQPADSLVYQTEKTLAEHGANLDPETRGEHRDRAGRCKKALEGQDAETIRRRPTSCPAPPTSWRRRCTPRPPSRRAATERAAAPASARPGQGEGRRRRGGVRGSEGIALGFRWPWGPTEPVSRPSPAETRARALVVSPGER